jgi:tripartite-type tricarboxylate transporter receptor subunit TctC
MELKIAFLFCLIFIGNMVFPKFVYSQQEEIQKFPTRPINFIIPVAAGGPTDLALRLIAKEAENFLGQPIVVVNKGGGGQAIGMAAIATAKPDGYTVGQSGNSGLLLVPHLEKVPYHPIRDFKQIVQCGGFNFGIIVKADSPFKTFKDLVAYARQNPKKMTYAAPASSIQYLIMEQIAKKENVQFAHIPFSTSSQFQPQLLGGHIVSAIGDFSSSLVEAGQIRVLVLVREERSDEYPQAPILKDLGYDDIPAPYYLGICGPSAMPEGIGKKLEEAFTNAMKGPSFIKGMKQDLRLPILHRNSKQLTDFVALHYEIFGRFVKEKGLAK